MAAQQAPAPAPAPDDARPPRRLGPADVRGRAAAATAVVLNLAWLTGHLTAGVLWRLANDRGAEMFRRSPTWEDWVAYLGTDPAMERLTGPVDTLVPWLLLSFPVVALSWQWLPRRVWFAALWVVGWPLGMILLRGYGTFVMS